MSADYHTLPNDDPLAGFLDDVTGAILYRRGRTDLLEAIRHGAACKVDRVDDRLVISIAGEAIWNTTPVGAGGSTTAGLQPLRLCEYY